MTPTHVAWPATATHQDGGTVDLIWAYWPTDPVCVHMLFGTGTDQVWWQTARTLLAEALVGGVGRGDVRLTPWWPTSELVIELHGHDGTARLTTSLMIAEAFLSCTEHVLSEWAEQQVVDAALGWWLDGLPNRKETP